MGRNHTQKGAKHLETAMTKHPTAEKPKKPKRPAHTTEVSKMPDDNTQESDDE